MRAGIEIPDARLGDLEKGVQAAIQATGAGSPGDLYELLAEKGPRGTLAFEAMIPAVTINETHFFRNRPQMQALESEILPQLIKARADSRRLRIWSAACSSGEEPYSVAMLLHRLLRGQSGWDVLIHGTDIDQQALAKAADGVYGNWSFREVPPDVKQEYFTQTEEHRYLLSPEIKRMVKFTRLNLVDDLYPTAESQTDRMDLVICRNVLIYFREEAIRRIVGRFHDSLVDNGWLVVGHAEPSQEIFHQFHVKNFPGTITYRKGDKAASAPATETRRATPVRAADAPPAAERRPVPERREAPAPRSREDVPRKLRPAVRERGAGSAKPAPAGLRRPAHAASRKSAFAAQAPTGQASAPADTEIERLIQSGRLDDAAKYLGEAIKAAPKDPRPRYELAKLHANRLRWDEAEKCIDAAIKVGQLAPEAYYLRGLILQELGRPEEAVESLRNSAFLDHSFVLAHFASVGLLARLGQTARAQKALETTIELLEQRSPDEVVPHGDGITVSRLLDLATLQRQLVA